MDGTMDTLIKSIADRGVATMRQEEANASSWIVSFCIDSKIIKVQNDRISIAIAQILYTSKCTCNLFIYEQILDLGYIE